VAVGDGRPDARTLSLAADATEPVRVDLEGSLAGSVALRQVGEGRTRATLARTTWAPWSEPRPTRGRLTLDVRWPEEPLPVGRPASAVVAVHNRATEEASVVTVEVGIPPGCDVEPEDVRGEGAEKVEREETRVVIYLRTLGPGRSRTFRLVFRPRYALDVVTAPSKAYEYYCPEEAFLAAPVRVRAVR
jgi:hypothetical protein